MSGPESAASRAYRPGLWALALTAICVLGAWYAVATRNLPTHDAIGWHGVYHYYAEVLGQGRFPWWNPYSRGGEPFFPYLQLIGLVQPSYLIFVALQKASGIPSVIAYSSHYFFQIYLFVIGIFLVVHRLTRNPAASALFALLALLGFLPSVFRQNGAILGFVFIPLLHYFAIRFFEETRAERRGVLLFMLAAVSAIGVNSLIAIPIILFLLCLTVGLVVADRALLCGGLRYLGTRSGARWLAASIAVSALLVAPVVALFLEFRLVDELFPLIRLLQHGQEQFPQCFASDLASGLFSERHTGHRLISMTPENLLGLFYEPLRALPVQPKSEITLFLGSLTLVSAALAIWKVRSPWKAGIILMLLVPVAASVNFNGEVHAVGHPVQLIARNALPFLKLTDVVQNNGVLMLYSLALLGGMGLRFLRTSRAALVMAIVAPLLLKFLARWGWFEPSSLIDWLIAGAALLVAGCALRKFGAGAGPTQALFVAACAVLALEMYAFDKRYLSREKHADGAYYEILTRSGLLNSPPRGEFPVHKRAFAFPDSDQFPRRDGLAVPVTFYGRDAMEHRGSAFPSLVRRYTHPGDEWKRYPMWDHLYSTRYYYDYLVNVDPLKQLVYSGVVCPAIGVVPASVAIDAASPREAASVLNAADPSAGPVLVLLAAGTRSAEASAAADRCFSQPSSVLDLAPDERHLFKQQQRGSCPVSVHTLGPAPVVERFDESSLVLRASAPARGGYLYLADGYSRHWKAWVDGKPTKVLLANLAYKAVELPPGEHRVELRYEPDVFRLAIGMYLLGLFVALGVLGGLACDRFRSGPPR
jgi:hypothetical protein